MWREHKDGIDLECGSCIFRIGNGDDAVCSIPGGICGQDSFSTAMNEESCPAFNPNRKITIDRVEFLKMVYRACYCQEWINFRYELIQEIIDRDGGIEAEKIRQMMEDAPVGTVHVPSGTRDMIKTVFNGNCTSDPDRLDWGILGVESITEYSQDDENERITECF